MVDIPRTVAVAVVVSAMVVALAAFLAPGRALVPAHCRDSRREVVVRAASLEEAEGGDYRRANHPPGPFLVLAEMTAALVLVLPRRQRISSSACRETLLLLEVRTMTMNYQDTAAVPASYHGLAQSERHSLYLVGSLGVDRKACQSRLLALASEEDTVAAVAAVAPLGLYCLHPCPYPCPYHHPSADCARRVRLLLEGLLEGVLVTMVRLISACVVDERRLQESVCPMCCHSKENTNLLQ